MRRYLLLFCLLAALPCLAGCWDAKDIDNRMIVGAMGVERPDNNNKEFRVWLRFPIPKTPGTSGKGQDFFAISQEGSSIIDATNRIRLRLPKALDLSSVRAFLIDESLAKEGLKQYLDFVVRERSVPLDTVVALVTGEMKQIFSNPNPTGELSGIYTKLFFESYAGGIPRKNKVALWEVYANLYNPLHENLIPLLQETEHNMFSLQGNAFFSGDKLVGLMTPEETLMYEIIAKRISDSEIELSQKANVTILRNHTKIKVRLKANGQPSIHIKSRVVCTLISSTEHEHLTSRDIENFLEDKLTRETKALFAKTQAKQSDIFGFGDLFRGKLRPEQHKDWPKLYEHADIQFQIKVNMRNTGLEYLD